MALSRRTPTTIVDRPKKRGRPSKPMPDRIDADPRDIARAIMTGPPKKRWRFLEKAKAS